MSGRIEFTFTESSKPVPRLQDGDPFRIVILGDFIARVARGALDPGDLTERPLHLVDVDTIDTLFRKLSPVVPGAWPEAPPRLHALDDLHPDRLLAKIPALAELSDLRRRLSSSATAVAAAEEVRDRFGSAPRAPEPKAVPERPEDDAGTLERLLGRPSGGGNGSRTSRPALEGLLRDAVRDQLVPSPAASHEVYLQTVERALSLALREILHDVGFRRLEAAWRSLQSLVGSLETGEDLEVRLLDVAREEIEADLTAAAGSIRDTELFGRLVVRGPGGPDRPGWSLWVLDASFGPEEPDLALLGSLGRLASAMGAPLLAGAAPSVVGLRSWADTTEPRLWEIPEAEASRWAAFRRSDPARWTGLAAPRLLLRQPYGSESDPIDAFSFEERDDPADLSSLLWGNGAFGCARVLGRRIAAGGAEPGDSDIEDLPACMMPSTDGLVLVPCAETYLSESAVAGLLDRGVMAWMSDRSLPRARLVRLQSLADPPGGLPGVAG